MTKGSLGFNVLGFRGCLATRFPDDPLSCERTSAQSTLDMLRGGTFFIHRGAVRVVSFDFLAFAKRVYTHMYNIVTSVQVHIYIYAYVPVYACIYACVYVYMYNVYAYVYIYIHVYAYIHVHMYISRIVCIYIYIHMRTYDMYVQVWPGR